MHPFLYERATASNSASAAVAGDDQASFIAGGTSEIDLIKENVHRPKRLVDVASVTLKEITELNGGLRIGAGVSNSAAAAFPDIVKRYPVISEALLSGASIQIRNMASMGGNPLQRTRCPYFRDTAQPCNKRDPGTGCGALEGINRTHAIFGASPECVATQAGDLAIALTVLDAVVQTEGPKGTRAIPFADFYRLPGDTPQIDTVLEHGELILSIDLPAFSGRSHYLKVRDRASYAYALVSCGVAVEMEGDTITKARVALGAVAHKPWRALEAEELMIGKKPSLALFEKAADITFANAKPLEHNRYKIPLGRNIMIRCLMETSGLSPLSGPAGSVFAANVGGVAGIDHSLSLK